MTDYMPDESIRWRVVKERPSPSQRYVEHQRDGKALWFWIPVDDTPDYEAAARAYAAAPGQSPDADWDFIEKIYPAHADAYRRESRPIVDAALGGSDGR